MPHRRYQKRKNAVNLEDLVIDEIKQLINEFSENKRKRKEAKNLKKIEAEKLRIWKIQTKDELSNRKRENTWNGLRIRPNNSVEGRNWTTYICLKKKRSKFPDDLMSLINQFLNWVPAGCWNPCMSDSDHNRVTSICLKKKRKNFPMDLMKLINQFLWKKKVPKIGCTGCGIKFLDSTFIGVKVCSNRCYEITLRQAIVSDYETCVHSIPMIHPLKDYTDVEFETRRMGIRLQYNHIFYESFDSILDWHIWWNTPSEYYSTLDYYDKWGIRSYSGSDSDSDSDFGDYQFYDHIINHEIDSLKYHFGVHEFNDDIWNGTGMFAIKK